jgi:structural maintenance of chromosome 4
MDIAPAPQATPRPRQAPSEDQENQENGESFPETFAESSVLESQQVTPKKQPSGEPDKSTVPSLGEAPLLSTPQLPMKPEPRTEKTPLGDITKAVVNGQPPSESPTKTNADFTRMLTRPPEKPMDIVIRTRATGVTQVLSPPEPPKSRMVIRYLVLTNFKSYAGRQEVGPFHASFSSVVGPNGSGKSNVIDSLLFVFGFRASKMRQGKISALIHNSANYPDLPFCEVEVHFQEVRDLLSGQHEVVPESDLIISRKAFKNNSSKYYMNKRESNFTDVTTYLKEKGVDLDHKRFLILQGEVESIAQMKPKAANEHEDGLLEYLEDIIGTSKYKKPIEESAGEVESLNEVCVEKSARVQHVEKEKNGLEDKKNKAVSFIQHENELAQKQSALYQVYIDECTDNLGVAEEAVIQMKSQLDEEQGKHQGNEDEIKQLEKAYEKGQKEQETLEASVKAIAKEMAKFEKERVKFDEKKKFLVTKQKKLEKTLQTSRLAGSEADSLIQKFEDDIERNGEEIKTLETEMKQAADELETIRENLKGKTQTFSDQIAAKQKGLEPWVEKISTVKSAIAVVQSELDMLHESAAAGQNALNELNAKKQELQSTKQEKAAELKQKQTAKKKAEADHEAAQKDFAKLSEKEPIITNKLSAARQKADEARASLSNSQSRGKVLNGLMRLKESGRIEGFHGRLGNLGTIDAKYDVAISTACPALENLVVDTVEVGQQCIDYLRKNSLGRANIILLDRLARRDLSPVETPENVPRLFDLVKAKEERFRPAFYSVLQNTLVAENLEQANRIAYGARRWRVVTLDGALIDVSGTMSGGGTAVAKGAMSSKAQNESSKEEVSALEAERDAIEEKYRQFQERQQVVEAHLKELADAIPALDTEIQKSALEIESLERKIVDIDRRMEELRAEEKSSSTDEAKIKSLEKQKDDQEKELAKLHTQTAGLEEQIKQLNDKIMEVGGVKLRTQKAKVDGLKQQIDLLNDEMSNADVSKTKATKDKKKHEKSYAQAEKDMQLTSQEIEALEHEGSGQNDGASSFRGKADQANGALEDKKEELDAMKKDLAAKMEELNEIRGIEIEMKNKLEENQKALAENQKRLRYWQEKLDKLALQPVSDLGDDIEEQELSRYTKDELQGFNKDTLKAEIAVLEEKTDNVNVDLGVLNEYRRRVEEHASRSSDLQEAVNSRDTAKKRCDDLRNLRLEGFMEGFGIISLRLKEMYQMITMGGNAELELVDSLDPFSEGILFSVMPPKKSWKNISNLSGGEKTLSSLALVFALHHYKPTPLYVMDEIDAALDFRNVSFHSYAYHQPG